MAMFRVAFPKRGGRENVMKLDQLIMDDPEQGLFRVHRSTMTSEEVQRLEQERIFDRSWVYVGHESELPNPGDFIRRRVASRPMFFVHGKDGKLRAFLNTCRHRGAMVCRQDYGNAAAFQCFYHGWTYDNKGDLIGVPDEEGYAPAFDKSELGLMQPPLVEQYRGFYFACFDRSAQSLDSYLGDVKVFLDIVIDQTEGGIRILPGPVRYAIRANWKLLVENSVDGYHVPTTHQSYIQYLKDQGVSMADPKGRSWGIDIGHGHGAFSGRERSAGQYGGVIDHFTDDVKVRLDKVKAQQIHRYGKEREDWAPGRVNFLVYPNMAFVGKTTLRTIWPVSPGLMEITGWAIVPKNESAEEQQARINEIPLFQGPGGFASPDDLEALESSQLGYAATEVEWNDLSKGMDRAPKPDDELQMRAFWRQWQADMLGLPQARNMHDLTKSASS
jgi:p-cumate 2,3-dioxygenase alpha subunit